VLFSPTPVAVWDNHYVLWEIFFNGFLHHLIVPDTVWYLGISQDIKKQSLFQPRH